MVELIVLYKTPNDPEHFEKYYREVHGPMTTKLAGVKSYSYGPVRAVDGGGGEFFWYCDSSLVVPSGGRLRPVRL